MTAVNDRRKSRRTSVFDLFKLPVIAAAKSSRSDQIDREWQVVPNDQSTTLYGATLVPQAVPWLKKTRLLNGGRSIEAESRKPSLSHILMRPFRRSSVPIDDATSRIANPQDQSKSKPLIAASTSVPSTSISSTHGATHQHEQSTQIACRTEDCDATGGQVREQASAKEGQARKRLRKDRGLTQSGRPLSDPSSTLMTGPMLSSLSGRSPSVAGLRTLQLGDVVARRTSLCDMASPHAATSNDQAHRRSCSSFSTGLSETSSGIPRRRSLATHGRTGSRTYIDTLSSLNDKSDLYSPTSAPYSAPSVAPSSGAPPPGSSSEVLAAREKERIQHFISRLPVAAAGARQLRKRSQQSLLFSRPPKSELRIKAGEDSRRAPMAELFEKRNAGEKAAAALVVGALASRATVDYSRRGSRSSTVIGRGVTPESEAVGRVADVGGGTVGSGAGAGARAGVGLGLDTTYLRSCFGSSQRTPRRKSSTAELVRSSHRDFSPVTDYRTTVPPLELRRPSIMSSTYSSYRSASSSSVPSLLRNTAADHHTASSMDVQHPQLLPRSVSPRHQYVLRPTVSASTQTPTWLADAISLDSAPATVVAPSRRTFASFPMVLAISNPRSSLGGESQGADGTDRRADSGGVVRERTEEEIEKRNESASSQNNPASSISSSYCPPSPSAYSFTSSAPSDNGGNDDRGGGSDANSRKMERPSSQRSSASILATPISSPIRLPFLLPPTPTSLCSFSPVALAPLDIVHITSKSTASPGHSDLRDNPDTALSFNERDTSSILSESPIFDSRRHSIFGTFLSSPDLASFDFGPLHDHQENNIDALEDGLNQGIQRSAAMEVGPDKARIEVGRHYFLAKTIELKPRKVIEKGWDNGRSLRLREDGTSRDSSCASSDGDDLKEARIFRARSSHVFYGTV